LAASSFPKGGNHGVRWNLDDMVIKGGFESREAMVATAIENKLMVTTLKDE